jgi:hypothetical protein
LSFNDKWARKKVEESIKEYVKGIWEKANLVWVVGEVNFAVEKMLVPLDEIRAMISRAEASASEDGKRRVSELRKRLGI